MPPEINVFEERCRECHPGTDDWTVCSHRYKSCYLRVMTSMALRDDLQSGESYYIVEIKSLNRILEATRETTPLLCVIDEVLRGTNTIERIAASSNILAALCREHVLSFAATHDIELSYMLKSLYTNYHFEEEVKEHDVVFNYLLKKGRATTRNAIRLLEMIGYDQKIIENAKRAAEMAEKLSAVLPYPLVYTVTAKSSQGDQRDNKKSELMMRAVRALLPGATRFRPVRCGSTA